jgi:hypothetical protein
MSYEDFDFDFEPEYEDKLDPAVAAVSKLILELFDNRSEAVFYETQLAIFFERDYFHWVTTRALKELRLAGQLGSELQPLVHPTQIRFYFHKRNRYWRRRAAEIKKLVASFSEPAFTQSLGLQGEAMVDAGFPRVGFMPRLSNAREWKGIAWTETGHDLDRIMECDGLAYGVEIKNKLGYIDQKEFRTKLAMCEHLNLVPLFVARFMPRTYMNEVVSAGGFSLLMKYQFYPFAHKAFAKAVRESLELPVDCPERLLDGTLNRLLSWHQRNLAKNIARRELR